MDCYRQAPEHAARDGVFDSVMISFLKAGRAVRSIGVISALALATAVVAQTAPDQDNGDDAAAAAQPDVDTGLNIPPDSQIFGHLNPDVRKPTAVVNNTLITGTDVDQRVALIESANNLNASGDDLTRLKGQVLRQLIDETLEVQEAEANDVKVTPDEVQQGYARVAKNFNMTPQQMHQYLIKIGSSDRSLNGQIKAQLAWSHYLRKQVEPFINVGDQEVQAILDRLKASEGTEEYHLKEIYMAAPPGQESQVQANMQALMDDIKKGQHPFEFYAQFSQASTRAVGGDLSWVRAATLPDSLATTARSMQVGQVAGPIPVPGGFSIIYLVDKRQVGKPDPRDARLSLRQLTITFPAGTTQQQAEQRASSFAQATQAIHGCGDVDKVAKQIGAEVVDNDSLTIRDLPPQLQDMMLKLQVGEATPPFGTASEGVRTLVLCGRDDPQVAQLPDADQVESQIEEQRVNLRAEQMLRDLRRDAIVEYR